MELLGQKSLAVMKDVPTKLSVTGYVSGMEQRKRRSTIAVMKDVPTELLTEVCASDTGQREILAVMTDVRTDHCKEEFV